MFVSWSEVTDTHSRSAHRGGVVRFSLRGARIIPRSDESVNPDAAGAIALRTDSKVYCPSMLNA